MSPDLLIGLALGFVAGLALGSESALADAERARQLFGPEVLHGTGDTPPPPPPPYGTACAPIRHWSASGRQHRAQQHRQAQQGSDSHD